MAKATDNKGSANLYKEGETSNYLKALKKANQENLELHIPFA